MDLGIPPLKIKIMMLESNPSKPKLLVGGLGVHPVRNPRFGSFRTQPLENLSAAVKLPIKKGFWATQPLEQILDSEFLLCELGVGLKLGVPENTKKTLWRPRPNRKRRSKKIGV